MKGLLTCIAITCTLSAAAQFAPQAGISGTTAVSATSQLIKSWASHCSVQRGLQEIGNAGGGYTTSGDSSLGTGAADGSLVSLGDSGVAVLTFLHPIIDGPGPDFAVFENGFANPGNAEEAFLELGFVEVSSDGVNYTRFPATSLTQDTTQLSTIVGLSYMNARLLNNLAGKYIAGYGTPFDLQELAGTPGLDINHITHVRIVDVIGDMATHVSHDAYGHKVNDPYPSPFPTGGFDLDAVGVINQSSTGIADVGNSAIKLFPNPATESVHISIPTKAAFAAYEITDMAGRVLLNGTMMGSDDILSLTPLATGIYFIRITDSNNQVWTAKLYRQ